MAQPAPEVASGSLSGEPTKRRSFWREWPVLVVLAFLVALLIKTFVLQAFYIPSESMEPTLAEGDRVLVEKLSYRFGEPERGDVVVFARELGAPRTDEDEGVLARIGDAVRELFGFPTGGEQDFIKRVVGTGGDVVQGRGGRVLVNGHRMAEPYLADGTELGDFGPVEIPPGAVFVMGDNRTHSDDSRNYGPIEGSQIVGKGLLLIWPPGAVSGL
ncbi:MAG: signal peptidase I [Actinobacteria bacterium]|nr:signal peptidase I [Actinomycetota bacterium]